MSTFPRFSPSSDMLCAIDYSLNKQSKGILMRNCSCFSLMLGLSLIFCTTTVAAQTVVITPEDPQGWGFFEEIPNGTGEFVNGPMMPPAGKGSVRMTVDGTGREIFGTVMFAGTRFDAVTALGYSTYRTQPAGGVLVISLQFNVDYDLTDGDDTWQGRLIYEPYYTETVEPDV